MKTIVYCAKWKRTTMLKVLVKHVTDVQKPRPKVRQAAMHVFQASTRLQHALIAQQGNSHTRLINLVAPSAQLDIMPKTFQKLRTLGESDMTDVLDAHVVSMETAENQLTNKQDVSNAIPVDFHN
jgi:hypothetical protein